MITNAIAALAVLGVSGALAATFHVAPKGNDAWSGTLVSPNAAGTDGPKATLGGARDAVRALKAKGPLADSVHVIVAAGEYPLSEPVTFTAADAGTAAFPVTYRAAAGARPVFLGGVEIKGFAVQPDGLWKASLPEAAQGKWRFEQLFVNDRRAVRAREPDLVPDTLSDVRLQYARMMANTARSHFAIADVKETLASGGKASQFLTVGTEAARVLAALDAAALADAVLMVYHNWDNTRRFIHAYDAAAGVLRTDGEAMKSWNPWKKGYLFHLENFRQALDAPGEWFLDRDGALLYKPRPGETPATARVFAPRLEKLVVFQGDIAGKRFVEHVRLERLAFRYSQWVTPPAGFEPAQAAAPLEAAVMADGARNLGITDCEIAHTGAYAVWFRRGCRDIRLERSLLRDFGAGGVRIGETRIAPAGDERTQGVTVHNNILRHGGRLFPCAVGVWIGQSGDNVVSRNDIGDLHYSGISAGWTWGYGEGLAKRNRFEQNHVHHIGKGLMSDMAAYYGLGPSEGTVIRGNRVHDVCSWSYGGWGLYTDEGSTGMLMEDNLVYNTKTGGFHQHYGRDNVIRNNIFAYSLQWQVQLTRVEAHRSFDFAGNIVYWNHGVLYGGPFREADVGLRKNLFWDATGAAVNFTPVGLNWQGRDIDSMIAAYAGTKATTLPQWQALGRDSGSRVADPLFQDPPRYDFRLKAGSPAPDMGFKAFDPSLAGVYGDPAWVAEARLNEEAPGPSPVREAAPRAEAARFRVLGAAVSGGARTLRLRVTLAEPMDGLVAEIRDSRGRRETGRRFGPLPAGVSDLFLTRAAPAEGMLFLTLRTPDGLMFAHSLTPVP